MPGEQRLDQPSKFDQAYFLAAAIGFLLINQQDRFGFGMAREGLIHYHPSAGSMPHLIGVLDRMERTLEQGAARLAEAVYQLASRCRRRDLLVVCSDLWGDRDELLRAFSMV